MARFRLELGPVPLHHQVYLDLKAALDEAEAVADVTPERIATAISFGSLMGARGNSGVIASQIFRGMADGLGGKTRFNGLDLAHALTVGAKTAYGAVAKPVEGTILTVIREAAEAAVELAQDAFVAEAAIVGIAGDRPEDLAAQQDRRIALAAPGPDPALAPAAAVGRGGVEEVDAGRPGGVHERERLIAAAQFG